MSFASTLTTPKTLRAPEPTVHRDNDNMEHVDGRPI